MTKLANRWRRQFQWLHYLGKVSFEILSKPIEIFCKIQGNTLHTRGNIFAKSEEVLCKIRGNILQNQPYLWGDVTGKAKKWSADGSWSKERSEILLSNTHQCCKIEAVLWNHKAIGTNPGTFRDFLTSPSIHSSAIISLDMKLIWVTVPFKFVQKAPSPVSCLQPIRKCEIHWHPLIRMF